MRDFKRLSIVIWGLKWTKHSHRFIHSAWYWALKREGFDVTWVEDRAGHTGLVSPGTVVFAFELAADHLPLVRGARYVGHNLTTAQSEAIRSAGGELMKLQVWTNQVQAVALSPDLPCVAFDAETRTLFQPWGTPFPEVTWRANVAQRTKPREFWIGSIWNDAAGQGNRPVMERWKRVLASRGVAFRKVPPGWPDRPSLYASLIRRSRMGSAIVGDWQRTHEYVPCRVFKNTSSGVAPSGNNPAYVRIFGDAAIVEENLEALADRLLAEPLRERQERLAEAQVCLRSYSYEQSLQRILGLAIES